MPDAQLPVVIAGGGIGGIATALACARRGIASIVCERRAPNAQDGAGIQIGPNGTRILAQLGVAERLLPQISVPEGIAVHSGKEGRALARLPLGDWIKQRHGSPYWTAHRGDLHAALIATAAEAQLITIINDAEVASYCEGDDRVDAHLVDGRRIAGRILIAADGLWSRLRAQIATTAAPVFPAGKCAYRSVIAREQIPAGLNLEDVHVWLGSGSHVVHYPVRAGREFAIVVIVDDEATFDAWNTAADTGWQERHAAAIPPALREALGSLGGWRMWSLATVPPLAGWTKSRAALLGDAAHPVLPFLAQGGVLALEDAVTIAARLCEAPGNEAAALRAYELERRGRALAVARASAANGRIYHLDGIMRLARDRVLGAVPASALMARYDWLYGWRLLAPADRETASQ